MNSVLPIAERIVSDFGGKAGLTLQATHGLADALAGNPASAAQSSLERWTAPLPQDLRPGVGNRGTGALSTLGHPGSPWVTTQGPPGSAGAALRHSLRSSSAPDRVVRLAVVVRVPREAAAGPRRRGGPRQAVASGRGANLIEHWAVDRSRRPACRIDHQRRDVRRLGSDRPVVRRTVSLDGLGPITGLGAGRD